MKQLFSVLGKIVLCLLLALVIAVIGILGYELIAVVTGGDGIDSELIGDTEMTSAYGIIQAIAFIVAVLLMVLWFEKKDRTLLGIRQNGAVMYALEGLLIGVVLITITFVLIWVLGGLTVEDVLAVSDIIRPLFNAFVLFTAVAISEEMFARGYVQGLVHKHYTTASGIIVSSLLFFIMHALNPGALDHVLPLLNIFLVGLLLALTRVVTNGIWLAIGIHLTWNFFQGSIYGFAVSGMPLDSLLVLHPSGNTLISGGDFGAEGSVISTVVVGLSVLIMYSILQGWLRVPTRMRWPNRG